MQCQFPCRKSDKGFPHGYTEYIWLESVFAVFFRKEYPVLDWCLSWVVQLLGNKHKNGRGKSNSGSFLDWIFIWLMKITGNMGNASKTTINKKEFLLHILTYLIFKSVFRGRCEKEQKPNIQQLLSRLGCPPSLLNAVKTVGLIHLTDYNELCYPFSKPSCLKVQFTTSI